MPASRETTGYLLGLAGVIIFAGTLPATRHAVATLDPWFVTFGRAAAAGALAGALLLALRRPFPTRAQLRPLAISGCMVLCGFPGMMGLAMKTVPAAHGGVVLGLLPLLTAAIGAIRNREQPGLAFWALSMLGAAVVIGFAMQAGGGGLEAGDLLLLLSALFAAIGYVYAADLSKEMAGWEVISWTCFLFLPLTVPLAYLFLPAQLGMVTTASWLGFAYVALFSQFIGFFAWNAGLAMGGVMKISQVQFLQTFFTIAIAALLNGESIGVDVLIAAGLVVAILIAMRRVRMK
jgi:drug/metabolite transporter (DMT)-like permease